MTNEYIPSPSERTAQQVALYESSNGREGNTMRGMPVVIVTHHGRKTGAIRKTPLMRVADGDRYVIVASMGGAPEHPSWFANILANPIVKVELGTETFQARATVADRAERRRLYDQHAELHPGFLDYETKTTREIPVVLLDRLTEAS